MILIKIGGGKDINIEGLASDLKELTNQCIIVHGANYYRDELASRLEKPVKTVHSISGQSSVYTDDEAMELIMMSYAGLRNKQIVERFQQKGINAIGLSGLDGKVIQGIRNRGVRIIENGKKRILHDLSGKPTVVNIEFLQLLLDHKYVPVLSIPIADENGFAINTDNDAIIKLLHSKLKFESIYQFIESEGIYSDFEDKSSFLKHISKGDLIHLEEKFEGRIKRKIFEIRMLFETFPTRILIGDGRVKNPLSLLLSGHGTLIE